MRTYEEILVNRWTVEHELLATLVERFEVFYRAFVRSNFQDPPDFGEPLRIPRPFDQPAEPKSIRDIFGAHVNAATAKGR